MKEFTSEDLCKAYPAYHAQSKGRCAKSLLDSHDLNEKWFFAEYCFERLLRKTYLKDLGLERGKEN